MVPFAAVPAHRAGDIIHDGRAERLEGGLSCLLGAYLGSDSGRLMAGVGVTCCVPVLESWSSFVCDGLLEADRYSQTAPDTSAVNSKVSLEVGYY